MPVPFGVSVGDFIVRIYHSLDDASYDAAMFGEAQRELVSFHIALMAVEQCLKKGAVLVDDDARRLKMVLDGCQKPMEDFQARVASQAGEDSLLGALEARSASSLFGKLFGAIRRACLWSRQSYISEQTPRLKWAVDEPWDTSPIRFQDATGRRYPVPLKVCNTFKVGLHHLSTSHRQTDRVQDMLAFINFALPDFGEAEAIE